MDINEYGTKIKQIGNNDTPKYFGKLIMPRIGSNILILQSSQTILLSLITTYAPDIKWLNDPSDMPIWIFHNANGIITTKNNANTRKHDSLKFESDLYLFIKSNNAGIISIKLSYLIRDDPPRSKNE